VTGFHLVPWTRFGKETHLETKSVNQASDIPSHLRCKTQHDPGYSDGGVRTTRRFNLLEKSGMKIAILNILTLNFPGAELLLTNELKQYSVAIAGLKVAHLLEKVRKYSVLTTV